MSQRFNETVFV